MTSAKAEAHHIALVGLPGAGKTSVARLVAAGLDRPALDFDAEIERRLGMPVSEIFATKGEGYFRDQEELLTRELISAQATILSPGGGWVTRQAVVALIRPFTKLVWLKVSPKVAARRMGTGVASRPLLMKGDPRDVLADLSRERSPLYGASDAAIDTEVLTPQQVADQVVQLATRWDRQVG